MANNVTGVVWSLDTAGEITTEKVRIKAIVYSGHTTGDVVDLRETTGGKIVFQLTDNTAPVTVSFAEPVLVPGLYLDTITAGTLLVYV
jgi:hypothetical protein